MITIDQIRKQLRFVVDRKIDLDTLDEWLSANSWNMHKDSPEEARDLVGKIEMLLAEFDSGQLSPDAVISEFRRLAPLFELLEDSAASSENQTNVSQFEWSAASDIRPSVGFSYTPQPQNSRSTNAALPL